MASHLIMPVWISSFVKYLFKTLPVFLLGRCLILTDLWRSYKKYINDSPFVSYIQYYKYIFTVGISFFSPFMLYFLLLKGILILK